MGHAVRAGITDTEPVPYRNTESVITKWSQAIDIASDTTNILVDLLELERKNSSNYIGKCMSNSLEAKRS